MIWLLIVFILIFLPLPVLITVFYKTNTLFVYIFGVKLYPRKKNKKNISPPKYKKEKSRKISLEDYNKIWDKINTSPVKPSLHFEVNIIYGLDDAAKTAILHGTLSSLPPFLYNLHRLDNGTKTEILHGTRSFLPAFLYNLLCSFLYTRKFKIDLKPNLEKSILEFKIKSIIWINFAKIIYMSLLVIFTLKDNSSKSLNTKEVI